MVGSNLFLFLSKSLFDAFKLLFRLDFINLVHEIYPLNIPCNPTPSNQYLTTQLL